MFIPCWYACFASLWCIYIYVYETGLSGWKVVLFLFRILIYSALFYVSSTVQRKIETQTSYIYIYICLFQSVSLFDATFFLCIAFFFFGGMALGVAPICLELGVECTYPVAEATSSGFQWMMGWECEPWALLPFSVHLWCLFKGFRSFKSRFSNLWIIIMLRNLKVNCNSITNLQDIPFYLDWIHWEQFIDLYPIWF